MQQPCPLPLPKLYDIYTVKLTPEQTAIIKSTGNIRINAVAGSGKTTTLIEYAAARPGRKILYLAFNRSVKMEAEKKFADKGLLHVQVETAHSLAYKYVIRGSQYTVKPEGGYKTQEIAKILGLESFEQNHTQYILSNHINKYISLFCNSSKAKVQEIDYASIVHDVKAKQFVTNFKDHILTGTRQLLAKMDSAEIAVTHDFYLKKFQQLKPQLPFDYILFDEGQDASEAMLDVFLHQQAIKVIVGDTHQQIYGWRYAVNSLDKAEYPAYNLSSSFRFDNEIASLAVRVLQWKKHFGPGPQVVINGYGNTSTVKTKAVIARTNTALLIKAIQLLIETQQVQKIYFEGRFETYTYADEGASIYDVLNLYLNNRAFIKDPLVAAMKDMAELEEYNSQTEDAQMALITEIVKKYGNKLPGYIKKIKESHLENADKNTADIIFSTVHRCKGMEYDEVTLTADFITEEKVIKQSGEALGNAGSLQKLAEEVNLLYVAVTRTRNLLNIPQELLPKSKINAIQVLPAEVVEEEPPRRKFSSLSEIKNVKHNNREAWTEEDDAVLVELFCKRIPFRQIARQLSRTVGMVAERVEVLELRELYNIY
jgi:F-box protein 18 (helicase)